MKKQSSYRIVLIFISVFFISFLSPTVTAQSPDLKFENLSVEQGLSNNSVNDIIQDKKGFLWIATDNGLNKYDGYKFTVYKSDPRKSNSLCNNKVNDILDTEIYGRQVLWLGTNGGLSAFEVETERFITWRQINNRKLSWDGNSDGYHCVMYDSAAREFKMWYTGYNTGYDDMKILILKTYSVIFQLFHLTPPVLFCI